MVALGVEVSDNRKWGVGLGGRFSLRRRVPSKNLRERKRKKKDRIKYIVSIIELVFFFVFVKLIKKKDS